MGQVVFFVIICMCCYLQNYYLAIIYNEKWVVWVSLLSCLYFLIFLIILEMLDGSPPKQLNLYIRNNPLYHDVTVIAKKEIFWWAMYILHLPLLWPVPESGAPIKTLLMFIRLWIVIHTQLSMNINLTIFHRMDVILLNSSPLSYES